MSRKTPLTTLIVGGAGFLGSALVHELLRRDPGRNIVVVGRSAQPRKPLPPEVRYCSGDAADTDVIWPLVQAADEIIDLAYGTVPKTSFDDPLFDVVTNLPSSVNLQRLACRANIRRYLLISSGGAVYGNTNVDSIAESHPTNPISPYGITKLFVEKYASFFHQMEGLPVVVVRPGNPYGFGQIGNKVQGFVGAAIKATTDSATIDIYGERGTVRDYVFIDDLAEALALALERGTPGSFFNVGTGEGHDNADVLDLLKAVVEPDGYIIKTRRCPSRPFDVARNVLDASLIKQQTGWAPKVSLAEGLQRVWHDWKQGLND